jgi:hypothetical protein
MESEIVSYTETTINIIALRNLLEEIMFTQDRATIIYEDNMAAIQLSDHPVGRKSKYLEVKMMFIREQIRNGIIQLMYISTAAQKADIMTKVLPNGKFLHDVKEFLGISKI